MFDSGKVTICNKVATVSSGQMPVETLNVAATAFYGDRNISYTRYYQAQGADCKIDRLIRVPWDTEVVPEQYAVFEDDSQYRIDAVADVIVKVSTRAKELTLVKLEQYLDLEDEEEDEE